MKIRPTAVAKFSGFVTACVIIVAASIFFLRAPDNTFDPFCTYTSQYSLEAQLQVGDEVLHSVIYRQRSKSRRWISTINYNGCKQRYGTTLSFRSADDRVFLVPTDLCSIAEEVLLDIGEVDVIRFCFDNWPNESIGFVVTTATNPQWWRPFDFLNGSDAVSLVSMRATETRRSSHDNLDLVAPNILKTSFEYGGSWWRSPERIISFHRRYPDMVFQAKKMP